MKKILSKLRSVIDKHLAILLVFVAVAVLPILFLVFVQMEWPDLVTPIYWPPGLYSPW